MSTHRQDAKHLRQRLGGYVLSAQGVSGKRWTCDVYGLLRGGQQGNELR